MKDVPLAHCSKIFMAPDTEVYNEEYNSAMINLISCHQQKALMMAGKVETLPDKKGSSFSAAAAIGVTKCAQKCNGPIDRSTWASVRVLFALPCTVDRLFCQI